MQRVNHFNWLQGRVASINLFIAFLFRCYSCFIRVVVCFLVCFLRYEEFVLVTYWKLKRKLGLELVIKFVSPIKVPKSYQNRPHELPRREMKSLYNCPIPWVFFVSRTKFYWYYFEYFPFVKEFHFPFVTKTRDSLYKWGLLESVFFCHDRAILHLMFEAYTLARASTVLLFQKIP